MGNGKHGKWEELAMGGMGNGQWEECEMGRMERIGNGKNGQ